MIYGTCDIETFGRTTDAVVIDVACIKVDGNRLAEDPDIFNRIHAATKSYDRNIHGCYIAEDGYEILVCNFSILDQIAKGRKIDPDTVAWHMRTPESADYLNRCFTRAGDPSQDKNLFSQLKNFFVPVNEIWFNGLSFDPPILKSLAETVGFNEDAWHFRKEFDNRTIYRKFTVSEYENPAVKDISAHTALGDCLRNLLSLRDLHYTARDHNLLIRRVPVDPTKTRV